MRFCFFPLRILWVGVIFAVWLAAGMVLADEAAVTVAPPQAQIDAKPAFVLKPGHRGSIRTALFTPDGHTLATVGFVNGIITLWDLVQGQPATVLAGDGGSVTAITFSPDGHFLAAAVGNDVVLWDVAVGKPVKTLSAHTDTVTALAFAPGGKKLASGASDNSVILWNIDGGQPEKTLTEQQGHITALAFTPDGMKLASGADDNTIFLWNLENGQAEKKLTSPRPGVLSLAFNPSGNRLAVATGAFNMAERRFEGGDVLLWDITADKPERTITGHGCKITALAFNPEGTTLAIGANDQTLSLCNVATGEEVKSLVGNVINSDWSRSASWSESSALTLWNMPTKKPLASFLGFDAGVNWFVSTPEGYFHCAPSAESLVSWQVGKLALTLEQLASKYQRPEVVRKALGGGDLSALPVLDATQLPPNIGFLAPESNQETNAQTVDLQLQAAGLHPITRVEITLNGQPLPPEIAHTLVVPHPADTRATFTITLPFPPTESRLQIRAVAYDANEIMGAPAEISLFRPGAKQGNDTLYVLAIGINEYRDLPIHLRYAAPDARTLVERCQLLLGQPYATVTPTLLTDEKVTAGSIKDALHTIAEHAKDTDSVLIYIAGHNVRDKDGNLFFAASDVDLADIPGTALSWDEMAAQLHEIHAARTLVLADTSISQGGPNRPQDNLPIRFLAKSKHLLFLATSIGETAMSRADWGHSAFMKAILEGLAGKADTTPQDGTISLQEFTDYVKKRVTDLSENQHPQIAQFPSGENPDLCWVVLPKLDAMTPQALGELLQLGDVTVHTRDHQGRTLLHQAVLSGREELVKLLLQHGADINEGDNTGLMPLHLAACANRRTIAELLMKNGAETGAEDKSGQTPLDLAMINNRGPIIDLLLPLVDPNAQDQNGMTPLHYAVKYQRREAVKLLLDKGARVTIADKKGRTALHGAATLNDADIVDLLLAQHANPLAADAAGVTPLHLAAENNLEEVLTHLLAGFTNAQNEKKALNVTDKDNLTPLHYAIAEHHERMVDLLCAHGANLNAPTKTGITALHLATFRSLKDVLLHLLKNGADINARDNDSHTPLHWAATMESAEMAKLLLDYQASPNPRDSLENTPLHVAARLDRLATVRALLEKGALPNMRNKDQQTPLAVAIKAKSADVVDYLRLHGGQL